VLAYLPLPLTRGGRRPSCRAMGSVGAASSMRAFRSMGAMIQPAVQRAEEYVDQHELGAGMAEESDVTQQ
jgi:hypothetical protein